MRAMRSRVWRIAPAWVLYAADITLTLLGQPAAYWAGDYAKADELNPVAHVLLAQSPGLFVAAAVGWALAFGAVVLLWRHPAAGWMAVAVAAGHAVGASTWLLQLGNFGWPLAIAYLVCAAHVSQWCWRRAADK